MTAENNGVPEDDDPFAYLYRAEGDAAGPEAVAPTQPMPGVPRTSYQQATQVGRTQYGAQPGYSQQPQAAAQQGYGYPSVPHQAPPAPPVDGGRAGARSGGGAGGSGRGVMIGAVAVVVAIAIGIGFALFGDTGKKNDSAAGSGSSQSAAATGGSSASASSSPSSALPGPADAATMSLQNTAASTTVPGAKAAGGSSVPLTAANQSVTWTVNVPADGKYYLWIRYDNPGNKVANGTLLVSGKKSRDIEFKTYSNTTDPANAWYRTYNTPDLTAGQVQITIQGADGQPPIAIDQLALTTEKVSPW